MSPSAPSTFKVRNTYSADINKLSYFLLMPTLQKGKSIDISARLYLILGMTNGTRSICEDSLICIILALFIWVFFYIVFFIASPECCTKVKIQGVTFAKIVSTNSCRQREPNKSRMNLSLTKMLSEQKSSRIQSSNVWTKMDTGWLSNLRVFLQSHQL